MLNFSNRFLLFFALLGVFLFGSLFLRKYSCLASDQAETIAPIISPNGRMIAYNVLRVLLKHYKYAHDPGATTEY